MYNTWFDFAGIAILVVIGILMYMKNSLRMNSSTLFRVLLVCCLLSTVSSFLSGYWPNHFPEWLDTIPIWAVYLVDYVYYVSHSACGLLFLYYILNFLNVRSKNNLHILIPIPYALIIAVLFSNHFTGKVFTIDADGLYHRGPFIFVVYMMTGIYLVLGLFLLIRYGKTKAQDKMVAMLSFLVIAIAAVFVQFLVPDLLLENYCTDLCLLFVYLTMYRPEDITDAESGLLNQFAFNQTLDIAMAQKHPFSLIYLNIYDAPYIQNTLGDQHVRIIEKQLSFFLKGIRGADRFRLGNGTYCLFFPNKTQMIESKALLSIVKRFEQNWSCGSEDIMLAAHILIIDCPKDASTKPEIQDMIDACDIIKTDRHVLRKRDLDIEHVQWLKDIDRISRNCVEEKSLEVVYQPVYNVHAKRVTAAEALVRLKDPVLGRIPSDELVSIAEKNGTIAQIDNFVLQEVCDFLSKHTFPDEGINVNLSMVECVQDRLLDRLCSQTNRYGVSNRSVRLEITETAVDRFPEKAKQNIQSLCKVGFTFCMDDFGQGYSNLDRLVSLPLEIIKLDKEFIYQSIKDPKVASMMEMLISTLNGLGKKTLIEGVETEDQARLAISMGCDYIQGYFYSKPLSQQDFIDFMQTQTPRA